MGDTSQMQCSYVGLMIVLFAVSCQSKHEVQKKTYWAAQGTQVTLRCQTNSSDQSKAEWFRPDQSLTRITKADKVLDCHDEEYSLKSNSSGKYNLIVKNVTAGNAGTYECNEEGELSKALLVVCEKFPSEELCSVVYLRDDEIIVNKTCHLTPDAVLLSCAISCTKFSSLGASMKWSMDGRIVLSNETKTGTTTVSSVRIAAGEIHSSTVNISCRVKYNDNDIHSTLSWSTTIDLTPFPHIDNLSSIPCDQRSVNCSGSNQNTCIYTWLNESEAVVGNSDTLDLNGQPSGIYRCLANCSSSGLWCQRTTKQIDYTCNVKQEKSLQNKDNHFSAEPWTSPWNSTKVFFFFIGLLVVVSLVAIFALIELFRRSHREKNFRDQFNVMEHAAEKLLQLPIGHHEKRTSKIESVLQRF